jgi:predicted enzyme related to lactoylglutathione lyase
VGGSPHDETKDGRIVHINVPCIDITRAQEFYAGVFGWTFTPNTEDYVLFSDRGGIGGGLTLRSRPSDHGVLFFVHVSDIPNTLAAVESAGGSVELEKTPVGGPGFYALLRDCEGNRVGVYSEN